MSRFHKGMKITRAAVLLGFTLIFLLISGSMAVFAVDLGAANSLTVSAVVSSSAYAEDAASASVVFDLYQLADAVPVEGYDSYSYAFYDAYQSISVDGIPLNTINLNSVSLSNEQWDLLAQQAAAIALNGNVKAADGVSAGSMIQGLYSGLYLVIARGEGISDYVQTETAGDGSQKMITIARSANYTYSFAPALISLPTKAAEEDAQGNAIISTSEDFGEWIYNASMSLKPEAVPRYGGVRIQKNIDAFEGNEEATFVFRVIAEGSFPDNPSYRYSNIATIAFDANTGLSNTAVLSGIRAGAEVTVTEIYAGPRYDAGPMISPVSRIVVAEDGNELLFTASNTFNASGNGGHGIQNHFTNTAGDTGSYWEVEQQSLHPSIEE